MFELLSLIIIEKGGEDKRTRGLGEFEAPGEKKLQPWGAGAGWVTESHPCDRRRKGREKNSRMYSRTETNGGTEAE